MKWFLLVLAALVATSASAKRLRDRIYKDLNSVSFCFRRTNGTHQFGCTSDPGGNAGVVHLIAEAADVDFLVERGEHGPYVAAFTPQTFRKEALLRLRQSDKLAGALLLYPDPDDLDKDLEKLFAGPPAAFSDDQVCPNVASSLYFGTDDACDEKWNPRGSGLMYEDFDFPVAVIRGSNTTRLVIEDCYRAFNEPLQDGVEREWPLCAMELSSHMYAAVDTETCLRRGDILNLVNPVKFCDEMGDYNNFLFSAERNSSNGAKEESVIVVASRLDTFTLFDLNEFGGDSPVTGIVTALELARMLAKNPPDFQSKVTNVLFAFFHGEAFDYIGSSKLVYDLNNMQFPDEANPLLFPHGQQPPLSLNEVSMVIELGQLYNVNDYEKLFQHVDKDFRHEELLQLMRKRSQQNDLSMSLSGRRILPPSSLHSFLKSRRDVPAILVSDYDTSYTNRFYHSIYDDAKINLDYKKSRGTNQPVVQRIGRVAQTLAEFVFEEASGPNALMPIFQPNHTLINELLSCYLETASCPLFLAASNEDTPPFYSAVSPDSPWPQYVGVDFKAQFHGILTRNVLVYLTGTDMNLTAPDCKADSDQNVYEYVFIKGETTPEWWDNDVSCKESPYCGYCYRTLSFRRRAISPAFSGDFTYDYGYGRNYSAWAESVWKTMSARVFLKASPSLEHVHFAVGMIVMLLSFVLVYLADNNTDKLFPNAVVIGTAASSGSSSEGNGTSVATEPTHL